MSKDSKEIEAAAGVSGIADEFGGNSRVYAMSRNPFGIIYILPAIIIDVLIAELLIDFSVDTKIIAAVCSALAFVILTVPAATLNGRIIFTDKDVELLYGSRRLVMPWSGVTGLAHHSRFGLCLQGKSSTEQRMNSINGICVSDGEARIPLRLFGDRRFAMFYEVRDHAPSRDWMQALRVRPISSRYPLLIYGAAVIVCGVSIFLIGYFVD